MTRPSTPLLATAGIIAVLTATACQGDSALRPAESPGLPKRISRVAPSLPVTLLPDGRAMVAATYRPDSVNVPVQIARVTVQGEPGDSVALKLDAESSVLESAGSGVRLIAQMGSTKRAIPLAQLVTGVTVHRFVRSESITMVYLLTKEVKATSSGTFRLEFSTSASLVDVARPWASTEDDLSGIAAASPPNSGTITCGLTAATGNCGPVTWAVNPYGPGVAFPGFQNAEGTGPASPITITFSAPITSVSVTIYDPTFGGNSMTAYNSGSATGSVSFAFSGTPGTNVPDTKQLNGPMTSLVLTPAANDYVTYQATIVVPNKPTLIVTCSPRPVIRGGDITCSARSSDNGAFSVFTADIKQPDGTTTLFSGTSLQAGKSWESKGKALFSTTVELTATPKGSTNFGELSGNTQIVVNGRTDFPPLSFPGPAASAVRGGSPNFFEFEILGIPFRWGWSLTGPDTASLGTLPVIDPPDGPFATAGAIFGALSQLRLSRPIVEIAPALFREGLLYEDQDGRDSLGTAGRNGRSICNNATDPGWVDRLRAYIERHEGVGGQSPSHYSIYVNLFQTTRPQDGIESMVFSSSSSQDALKKRIYDHILLWRENDAKPFHLQFDASETTIEKLDEAAGCSIDYEIKEQRGVIIQ
jgi:hypothetical protein